MNRLEWLDTATKKILFRPDRKAVRKELEAHLEDLREASGLDEETAVASMGDPAALAEELGRLHRPWLGYLWRASQIALIGAAVMYCLVLAILAARPYFQYRTLPGVDLYNYLQADTGTMAALYDLPAAEERELLSGTVLETGGYTIRNNRAVYRRAGGEDGWCLYIDLDITESRWEEPLDPWFILSGIRTNKGDAVKSSRSTSVDWGLWQKCAFALSGLPEDAEWVELDLGWGEWKRTLRIDLTEEAET